MNSVSTGITIVFQLFLTFIVLFTTYMVYALFEILEFDMVGAMGFLIFQPLLGFIFVSLTIFVCLLVGLPIRLLKAANVFWLSKPFLPLTGAAIALILLLLAYSSWFKEIREVTVEYTIVQKEVPSITLSLVGWFLTGFCLLHFYPHSLLIFYRNIRKKGASNQ